MTEGGGGREEKGGEGRGVIGVGWRSEIKRTGEEKRKIGKVGSKRERGENRRKQREEEGRKGVKWGV